MKWCAGQEDEWRQIIENIAWEQNLSNPEIIEKDAVQSMFLNRLSQSSLSYVFKGGTSLSKVYGIINRFSEDIDISMTHKATQSERSKVKKEIISIANNLGFSLLNSNDIYSNRHYNKYEFAYDSLFNLPIEIIIETSLFHPIFPFKKLPVKCIVSDYCESMGINPPINLNSVNTIMRVQSLDRIFIDKVFAICDYMLQGINERHSRHLYDIAKILPYINIDEDLNKLINEVRDERMTSSNNLSAQPKYNIPELLKEMIQSRYYEKDYNLLTKSILYEDVSYDEAVKQGIALIANMNLFEYKRNYTTYLEEFPNFDDLVSIKQLSDWRDISKNSDGMPSFERRGKDGSLYKVYLNYMSPNKRKIELSGSKRILLLKDGEPISVRNNIDAIISDCRKSEGDDPQGQGCGR